jgi:hypothetical protein
MNIRSKLVAKKVAWRKIDHTDDITLEGSDVAYERTDKMARCCRINNAYFATVPELNEGTLIYETIGPFKDLTTTKRQVNQWLHDRGFIIWKEDLERRLPDVKP